MKKILSYLWIAFAVMIAFCLLGQGVGWVAAGKIFGTLFGILAWLEIYYLLTKDS